MKNVSGPEPIGGVTITHGDYAISVPRAKHITSIDTGRTGPAVDLLTVHYDSTNYIEMKFYPRGTAPADTHAFGPTHLTCTNPGFAVRMVTVDVGEGLSTSALLADSSGLLKIDTDGVTGDELCRLVASVRHVKKRGRQQ